MISRQPRYQKKGPGRRHLQGDGKDKKGPGLRGASFTIPKKLSQFVHLGLIERFQRVRWLAGL